MSHPTTPDLLAEALREMLRLSLEPPPITPAAIADFLKVQNEARLALQFWDTEKLLERHKADRNARNTPRTNPR